MAGACRLPTSPIRKAAYNGLNKKSGNLNAALQEIWPPEKPVDDRDVLVVLDADQAAFSDFLVKLLPCLDAGVESDNVALVQSPQVSAYFSAIAILLPTWLSLLGMLSHSQLRDESQQTTVS